MFWLGLSAIVQSVAAAVFAGFEAEARQRIQERDIDDWPLIALSMTLYWPIWTEDKDFFGIGIATWRRATWKFIYPANSATLFPCCQYA
jgi:predicted nucleic acid-binding protein